MKRPLIFGFGSLMDKQSLFATVPNATNIRPAYIKGFTRDFSFWDEIGWKSTNLDVAGEPFCALDVHASNDLNAIVNGIVFEMPATEMQQLLIREKDYELIATTAYDWQTKKAIGECSVFSSNKYNGHYARGSAAQERYWQICVDATKQYGDEFYETFLKTTNK